MNLSQIVKIKQIDPIPDADRIEKVQILGWQVVSRKGLYKVGDLAIFVFPDTLVPKKYLDESHVGDDKIRLKTIKMKKVFSAGLLLPLSLLPEGNIYNEGDEVSETLGITKFIKQIPAQMAGDAAGSFPTHFISKTDEDNLRSNPEVLDELKNYQGNIVGSAKYDGTSATFIWSTGTLKGLNLRVCSRNLELKPGENVYWRMAKKYNIEEKLKDYGGEWAIQSEIYGPQIQSNPVKVEEISIAVFIVKNLETGKLLSYDELTKFCNDLQLPIVETVYDEPVEKFIEQFKSGELQNFVNNVKYPKGNFAEGVVFKTKDVFPSYALGKEHFSVKIISENYKL